MEASQISPVAPDSVPTPASAPVGQYDVTVVHRLLDQVDGAYHEMFDGHVPDEVHRFEQFLNTVRMIVDQSADSASKE